MKKAILVNYSITTRIIVDMPEGTSVNDIKSSRQEKDLLDSAKYKIACNAEEYLIPDNADYWEDTDVPAEDYEQASVNLGPIDK